MNSDEIDKLLDHLSEHFDILKPLWTIKEKREDGVDAAYIDGIPALIEFYGDPEKEIVWHEFVHHVIYLHESREKVLKEIIGEHGIQVDSLEIEDMREKHG